MSSIRLAGIIRESIVDGPGLRFVIFCQGCPHECPRCHNPETHDFSKGTIVRVEKIIEAIRENPLLTGVTFSGGEPICQSEGFLELAKKIKKMDLDIMIYTGYTFEELIDMGKKEPSIHELLENIDFLVDGKYIEGERDLTLLFKGSRNQRYIDMKKTIAQKRIITI